MVGIKRYDGRKDTKILNGVEVQTPKYFVFKGLNQSYINEITAAIGDDKNPEDIQGRGNDPAVSDHSLDEERYKIMAIYKPIDEEKIKKEREELLRMTAYPQVILNQEKVSDSDLQF